MVLLWNCAKTIKSNISGVVKTTYLTDAECGQKKYAADTIVRYTGDCPLVDPLIIDETIQLY